MHADAGVVIDSDAHGESRQTWVRKGSTYAGIVSARTRRGTNMGVGTGRYNAGAYPYFAPVSTLFIVQMFMFAWVEFRRWQDMKKPGRCNPSPHAGTREMNKNVFLSMHSTRGARLLISSAPCMHYPAQLLPCKSFAMHRALKTGEQATSCAANASTPMRRTKTCLRGRCAARTRTPSSPSTACPPASPGTPEVMPMPTLCLG